MKAIIVLLFFCHVASPVLHSLKKFYTALSEVPNFPEFVIVVLIDGVQMVHYDSNTQRAEPRQDWMNKVTADDPKYLDRNFQSAQQINKANTEILKKRFNQTGGVHVIHVVVGCEWDDETGDITGIQQHGYDGEDLIALDWQTQTWITPTPQALVTKNKLDRDRGLNEYWKNYLSQECVDWLKKLLDYGKSTLQRTVLPSVSLLQTSPSSPVTCHATGFHPDKVVMFWMKDGEEVHEDMDHGETLHNHDGTFQRSVDLDVSSVRPGDWKRYDCVFQLSGVEEDVVIKLDPKEIKTNWGREIRSDGGSSSGFPAAAVIGVVVGLLLLAVCMAGVFMWRRRNNASEGSTSPAEAVPLN